MRTTERAQVVGERIKEMRIKKGYTQTKVSILTGINQSELSKIEQGKRLPTLHHLAKLAKLYDTSMDYLAGQTEVTDRYPEKEN